MRLIIEVRELVKRFGPINAVNGVTFDVGEGEVFGFLGPNGAGKTTTIRVLATLLLPTSGQVRLNGYDVVAQPTEVRRSIGIVFQDPSLDTRLTAEQNLRFHAMLYGVPRETVDARIAEVLAMVELLDRRADRVDAFSGGMKRRLEVARALLHTPKVLFLDEPTIGLDPQTRRRIWDYVLDLRRRQGVTVFMTTHYMDEAEHCDRIGIIDHGEIVALGTPSALKQQVGGDVVSLRSAEATRLAEGLRQRFGAESRIVDGEVVVERDEGAAFIPQVVAAFPDLIEAVHLQPPTLDDVFLKLTGRTIRDEEASATDRMRLQARAWRRVR